MNEVWRHHTGMIAIKSKTEVVNIPVYLSAVTLFINPVWKQMCCNCWAGTGDQSIHFSHVYWETTYKLRLYLSYNSSQVWPTRISGVIESVFRCSRPNSKSTVTLTRPMQRKNASLHLLPLFLGFASTGDFDIDYCETKICSRSTIIKTDAVPLNAKRT